MQQPPLYSARPPLYFTEPRSSVAHQRGVYGYGTIPYDEPQVVVGEGCADVFVVVVFCLVLVLLSWVAQSRWD
jgi:hypothetical protein